MNVSNISMLLDGNSNKLKFKIGEEFATQWGNRTVYHLCSRPEQNQLKITIEDRRTGWKMQIVLTFSTFGMESQRHFVTDGVTVVKNYLKL